MPHANYAKMRSMFFDASPAVRRLDRKTRRVLSKFGAYTRRSAQTSMKDDPKRGDVRVETYAKPGAPPRARGKKLLKRMLFFGYDADTKSVVTGPVRLQRTQDRHVPLVLEQGGTITRRGKARRYRRHPYMKPAFDKNTGWVAAEYAKP
ncbi:hypothetical protein [Gemmata sp.]|uniref:hypothetical protein n=1 Tax=Gemmata sp. TaxID=1914242 RepID=UPI003F6F5EBE